MTQVERISLSKQDFIRYIKNIDELRDLSLSFGNIDEASMSNEVQKIDSVHDFGSTRGNNLATDALTKVKEFPNFYCYNQMRLFFIQKYSFPSIGWSSTIEQIPIQWFSNISYPGVGPYQRVVNDVEDYCFLLALKNSITTGNKTMNNFKFVEFQPKNIENLKNVKRILSDFFSNYTNSSNIGTGKINLLVDTPGDLTKVLKSDKSIDDFAYIFLQESAHDSAKGKPTTLEPQIINDAYNGNGFCEVFGQTRTYKSGIESISQFESNFTITFKGMSYNPKPRETFQTMVSYGNSGFNREFPCVLNSLVHPTNVPQITKDVGSFTKGNELKLNSNSMNILKTNNINEFYNSFNDSTNKYNYLPNNQQLLDFNFTKKRAGDGLQARVCQLINSNGENPIRCWKMGSIQAGCDTRIEYIISSLILVTIDRVLFSYCVKNNVPAIYSGTNCFLFFNPFETTPFETTPFETTPFETTPFETTTLSKKRGRPATNQNEKLTKQSKQYGGGVTEEDKKQFLSIFTDIPFYLYKLIPKIINSQIRHNTSSKNTNLDFLLNIEDDTLTTVYANNRICLYTQDDAIKYGNSVNGLNNETKDYVIWLNDSSLSVEKSEDKFIYHSSCCNTTFDFDFDTTNITSVIHDTGYFTRSSANMLVNSLSVGSVFLSTLIGEEDEITEFEGGDLESSIPLLDTYYDNFYKKNILLDNNTLENNNLISLVSYFNIFSYYETCLCCDNDEYYQSFTNDDNLEVTNKLSMYILFKILLDDFKDKKDKIYYGLLEYFLNSGDKNQKYFSISDDLEKVIYYVFCNYKILGSSLNVKINDMISENLINENDTIYVNTLNYFEEIYPKIIQKTKEIEDYLTSVNKDDVNKKYIKKYLSIYGFMNMSNDFQDTINIKTSLLSSEILEEKTSGIVAKGLSKPELEQEKKRKQVYTEQLEQIKQKRKQDQEQASREQLELIKKQGIPMFSTGMRFPEQPYNINQDNLIKPVSVYAGGNIKKYITKRFKKIKKCITRRFKKIKNSKKKTIKNKKKRHKTRNIK